LMERFDGHPIHYPSPRKDSITPFYKKYNDISYLFYTIYNVIPGNTKAIYDPSWLDGVTQPDRSHYIAPTDVDGVFEFMLIIFP
ncbi:MAG: hypothetical protein PVH64_12785, partial [Bacillota bacterium]